MDENVRYLEEHFMRREFLATGIGNASIDLLVEVRLLPRACYFPDDAGHLCSNLGSTPVRIANAYFHVSAHALASDALALIEAGANIERLAAELRNTFIDRYVARVAGLHQLGMVETAVWVVTFDHGKRLREIGGMEYEHWIAGTYGLCTRANTAEAVAVKECMIGNIDHVTEGGNRVALDGAAREKVVRYIRLFDRVTALFAPYERPSSSRHRICEDLPLRYGLTLA